MADIASQIQVPNYGQSIQQGLGLRGMMLQQDQLNQQINANKAASAAAQAALDPATGQIDQAKFAAALQNTPYAYNIPEYLKKFQDLQNSQLETQTKQLDIQAKQYQNARTQLDYWGAQLGPLMQNPNVTKSDVIKAISGGVNRGMVDRNQAITLAQELPNDPAALKQFLNDQWLGLQSAKDQIGLIAPNVQQIDTGGQVNIVPINPLTGAPTGQNTVINKNLTPGEAASNVTVIDPTTGAQYNITKAQQLAMQQQPPAGGMGGGAGAYTGRFNSAPPNSVGPAGVPAGALQTGLGPAQQASLTTGAAKQAEGSATAAQELSDRTAEAPFRIQQLESAREALSKIQTGPGTEWRNNASSFLNAVSPELLAKIGVTDPEKIASYDEFRKIMTNYASSASSAVGGGTDARLNAAIMGNANPNISKTANADIITKTLAAEKMLSAQAYAFQNSGLPPDKFNQWRTQWNKEVNPEVFAFTSMDGPQQQKFLSKQTPDTLKKLKTDLAKLVQAGVIQMPGQ
jgi:hypothetical protein